VRVQCCCAMCCMSLVTRHTSHVTRHTPHVTRHASHVTRHTSHVTRHRCVATDSPLLPCIPTLMCHVTSMLHVRRTLQLESAGKMMRLCLLTRKIRCVCVCVYVRACVCVHACTHPSMCVHFVYTCACTFPHVCVYVPFTSHPTPGLEPQPHPLFLAPTCSSGLGSACIDRGRTNNTPATNQCVNASHI